MQEELSDLLKRVTGATLRAMSCVPDATVSYLPTCTSISKNAVTLPLPERADYSLYQIKQLRGAADAASLWLRFHDPVLHHRNQLGDSEARLLFDMMEQARVESFGANRLKAVALNLN